MRLGDQGLTSSSKDNSANASGEENHNEAIRGDYFLTTREKTLNQISSSNLSLYEPSFGGILNKVFQTYIPDTFHCEFDLDLEWL